MEIRMNGSVGAGCIALSMVHFSCTIFVIVPRSATHFLKCRPRTLIPLNQKLHLTQVKKVIEPNVVESSTD